MEVTKTENSQQSTQDAYRMSAAMQLGLIALERAKNLRHEFADGNRRIGKADGEVIRRERTTVRAVRRPSAIAVFLEFLMGTNMSSFPGQFPRRINERP
jgi:hypothetical protein